MPRHVKRSIVYQVLLLISVPLVFELVFVGSLATMLKQVEQEKSIIEQSRTTLLSAEQLYRSCYDLAQTVAIIQSTKSNLLVPTCRKRMDTIRKDLVELERCLNRTPTDERYAQRIKLLASQLLELIEVKLSELAVRDQSNSSSTQMPFLSFEAKELTTELNNLCEEQRKIGREKPQAARDLRQKLEILFWTGVAGSIVLAVSLALHFNRQTTSRLKILVDNSNRLAGGQALLPAVGGQDEITHLDGVFHEMARSLNEASGRMRGVIDCMPLALVTVKDDGTIDSINPGVRTYFGIGEKDAVGKPITCLFVEHQLASDFIQNLQQQAQIHSVERIAKRSNGDSFPVEISVSEFTIVEGHRWLITIEDVTEIREAQRIKQELTAIVSHELRTPLTSMQVFLTALSVGAYGEFNSGMEKRVVGIQRSVQRLVRLINDLLDSEKMSAGQLSINCERVNLAESISSAVDSVRELAEGQKVKLETDIADDVEVLGDVDRLAQVVVNLLSNAIKFSPTNSQIALVASKTDNNVRVSVTDHGPGIPQEYQEVIFERFQQVVYKGSKRKQGTGLGLSLSKYIIEQHHGEIGLTSESGKGSTFWFQLPLVPQVGPQHLKAHDSDRELSV
jgi:PAS domain S-box-containing protein